jgi:hypothetical protein
MASQTSKEIFMIKTTVIADHIPGTFMQAFQDRVLDGYYADDTVAGYPYFAFINEVTLARHPQPAQRHDLSEHNTVVIEGYDNVPFMFDVQDAILQGFEVDPQTVVFGTPHSVVLRKPVQAVLDATPVASDTPEEEDAPESTTEAPEADEEKPAGKQPRKAKSKETV